MTLLLALLIASPAVADDVPVLEGAVGDNADGAFDDDTLPDDWMTERLRSRWIDAPLPPQPSPYIVNGFETSDYPAVVSLAATNGRGFAPFCSGTLITESYVATAAHCVDALRQYEAQGFQGIAIFGSNLLQNQIDYYTPIVSHERHPRWNGSVRGGFDIATVELEQGPRNIDPMPLMTENAGRLVQGEKLDYVGFGITGDGRQDSGVKRTADIGFYQLNGNYIIGYDPEKNLCSGDSGGAGLRRVGGGHELAGVNSYVFDANGDGTSCFTGASGATRIDASLDFIASSTDWTPEGGDDTGDPGDDTGDSGDPGDDTGDPSDPGEDPPAVDYGDWTDPERPPEGGVTACASTGTAGGLGLLGALGLVGLLARRRR